MSTDAKRQQPMGPEPTILSRKEIEALYDAMTVLVAALDQMVGVNYIVTGGSLLGAIRQHSILFCDDDIDIAIIDTGRGEYERVATSLGDLIGPEYQYSIRPWEGGDRVRPKGVNSVFIDIFVIRRFDTRADLMDLIGTKKNGQPQSEEYMSELFDTIRTSAYSQGETAPLFPMWHFNTRKAIEMWPKEVYRTHELFPIVSNLKFGPLDGIAGPKTPVLLLKRAFGHDCFNVYYQSGSHKETKSASVVMPVSDGCDFKPVILAGGTWEGGVKSKLTDGQYVPLMPVTRLKRRLTGHGKGQLFDYLDMQSRIEHEWLRSHEGSCDNDKRPNRTVYMDGVFDLFHIGHLNAIQECVKLGNIVILGVTGDEDATSYKRSPIICESQRAALVAAVKGVDKVVYPCPLVVTEDFMQEHGIDLVVHGFANDTDADRQYEFFELPIKTGRFQRIPYYNGLSTTDIIKKIRTLDEDGF